MSIGIVSLATMFPLSIQRTVKGTQLTNATDLRFNAEAMLTARLSAPGGTISSQLITDPDLNPATSHTLLPFAPPLNPLDRYVVDPLGYNFVRQYRANVLGAAAGFGHPALGAPALEDRYGNDRASPPAPIMTTVRRYSLGLVPAAGPPDFFPQADYFVTLPDSWTTMYEGDSTNPVVFPNGAVPLPASGITQLDVVGLNASGFVVSTGINYRAVIFNTEGTASVARRISNNPPATDTILWTEDLNGSGALDVGDADANANGGLDHHALPPTFVPGKVRVEAQERRYTWLLTCRQVTDISAEVDVAVFFNRRFDDVIEDEALYTTFFNTGSNQLTVNYTVGGLVPWARRGGFVFDADNARWYRITNAVDNGAGAITVTLETPAIVSSPPAAALGGHAMFPRGVVDVFPLGVKP